MSKGIVNNRDKFVWDNSHKPDISDVVGEIDDKMDDLLDDHDDKVVDIVGDNMNDLLDAHDDKVVSIVGDNMGTLLTGAASTVQLIAGDKSGITTTPVKVGKWDATHDLYAIRATGEVGEITASSNIILARVNTGDYPVLVTGYAMSAAEHTVPIGVNAGGSKIAYVLFTPTTSSFILSIGTYYSGGTYDTVIYFIRAISS